MITTNYYESQSLIYPQWIIEAELISDTWMIIIRKNDIPFQTAIATLSLDEALLLAEYQIMWQEFPYFGYQ